MGDVVIAAATWRQPAGVPVKRCSIPEAPTAVPAPRIVVSPGLRGIFAAWAANNRRRKIDKIE